MLPGNAPNGASEAAGDAQPGSERRFSLRSVGAKLKGRNLRSWCRTHPRRCLQSAVAFAAVAVALLFVAAHQRLLTWALAWLLLGLAFGLFSMLLLAELLRRQRVELTEESHGKQVPGPNGPAIADSRALPRWVVLQLRVIVEHAWRILAIAALVFGLGAALTWWDALILPALLLTVPSLLAAIVAATALTVRLQKGVRLCPTCSMVSGVTAMAVGLVLLWRGSGLWLMVGALLLLAGLVGFNVAVLPLIDRVNATNGRLPPAKTISLIRGAQAWTMFGFGVALFVGGCLLAYSGTDGVQLAPDGGSGVIGAKPRAIYIGVAFAAIGLAGAGGAGTRIKLWVGERGEAALGLLAIVAAVAVLGFGMWRANSALGDWMSMAVVLSLILLAVGAWSLFRGEGLVALAVVTFVMAWALQDRDSQDLDAFNQRDSASEFAGGLLTLGDSFMSGEGASDFFAGTNLPGSNTCRRAATSFGALVAEEVGLKLHPFACSGAEIHEVLSDGQMPDSPDHLAGKRSQLASLSDPQLISAVDREQVKIVLLSAGGNDSGFGTVVKSCLLPSDCSERRIEWIALAESLQEELAMAYQRVDAATGDAVVLVTPYPNFIEVADCDRLASKDEFGFIAEYIDALNRTIYRAAADANEAGARILVFDNRRTFDGRTQCARSGGGPAANLVVLAPTEGPLPVRLNPANWVHGSMHPFADGHRLEANALVPLVDELQGCGANGCRPRCPASDGLIAADGTIAGSVNTGSVNTGSVNTESEDVIERMVADGKLIDLCDDHPVATAAGEGAVLAALGQALNSDDTWMTLQLYLAGRTALPPIASLLGGGLLGAIGLVKVRRRWLRGPILGRLGDALRFLVPEDADPLHVGDDDRIHVIPLSPTRTTAPLLAVIARSDRDGAPDETTVGYSPAGADGADSVAFTHWQYFPGGRHPFWWSKATVESLEAGTSYQLLDGQNPLATARTVPSERTKHLSLIVGSCYYRNNMLAEHVAAAYHALADDQHVLNFWLGDQVYVDAPWTAGLRTADIHDLVAKRYLDSWEIGGCTHGSDPEDRLLRRDPEQRFGAVVRSSGNWFLPDDHEFWNGYPTISYSTLIVHAIKRSLRLKWAKVKSWWPRRRPDPVIGSHPARQGEFGAVAGEVYTIFQSNELPFSAHSPKFDPLVFPAASPQVIQLHGSDQGPRIVMVDTRWERTVDRLGVEAGLMSEAAFDRVMTELDSEGFVVVMLSRPIVDHPTNRNRTVIDPGAEAYPHQYDRLCQAIVDRAQHQPTVLVAGDVHQQRVQSASNARLLEIVASPIVILSGYGVGSPLFNWIKNHFRGRTGRRGGSGAGGGAGNQATLLLPVPQTAGTDGPDDEGWQAEWKSSGGEVFVPPPGHKGVISDSGLVRLDLDLSDDEHPVIAYKFRALDQRRQADASEAGWNQHTFKWAADRGWVPID